MNRTKKSAKVDRLAGTQFSSSPPADQDNDFGYLCDSRKEADLDRWQRSPEGRPPVGSRVRLTEPVSTYHYSLAAGSEGTVAENSDGLFAVRMDQHMPGCEEWNNEACWYPEDDRDRHGVLCLTFTHPPVALTEED